MTNSTHFVCDEGDDAEYKGDKEGEGVRHHAVVAHRQQYSTHRLCYPRLT